MNRLRPALLPWLLVGCSAWTGRAAPPTAAPITAAAFAPGGETVLVGSQSGIQRLTWPGLEAAGSLATELRHVHDLRFAPDGRTLAAVGGRPAESGELELFEWPSGRCILRRRLGEELFYQVDWRRDGEQLALAGGDTRVLLVDRQGQLQRQLAGHSRGVLSVAYLEDGQTLISAGLDQSVRVWDVRQGTLLRTLDNHTAAVHDVAVRPHDATGRQTIATAGADRTVRLWWPLVGRLVRFARLPSPPLDVAWTTDGSRIVVACADGHFRVIDPDSVQIVAEAAALEGWAYTVAVRQDGQALVAGANGAVERVP